MGTFHTAYDELLTVTEQMSAFYPKDIYEQLRECLKVANMEDTDLKLSGPDTFSSQWHGRGRTNMDEFLASFNKVSDLIRERISKLAVVRAT
jgi:hypothetical protein